MKIPFRRALFVTHWLPLTPESAASGGARRMQLIIDAIKQVSNEVEILLYDHYKEEVSAARASLIQDQLNKVWGGSFRITICRRNAASRARESFWRYYVKPVFSFFSLYEYDLFSGSAQIDAFEECLTRNPDYVFVLRLKCMPPVMQTQKKLPPVFVDLDDIEHLALQRSISQPPLWLAKRLQWLWVLSLALGEKSAIRLSEKTFVCSEIDKQKLKRLFGLSNVEPIANTISIPVGVPLTPIPNILLLGHYSHPPNRIGAEFFLDQVWPKIKAAAPKACLIIAGPNSDCIHHSKKVPAGVIFKGYVEDLSALYAETKVVVCPILSGGGTRVKIMEAAAYGKPVVSTTLGAEGIDLCNESEILLRDDPGEFAKACVDLLHDDARASMIGVTARTKIEKNYERSRIVDQLAGYLQQGGGRTNDSATRK